MIWNQKLEVMVVWVTLLSSGVLSRGFWSIICCSCCEPSTLHAAGKSGDKRPPESSCPAACLRQDCPLVSGAPPRPPLCLPRVRGSPRRLCLARPRTPSVGSCTSYCYISSHLCYYPLVQLAMPLCFGLSTNCITRLFMVSSQAIKDPGAIREGPP